MLLCKEKGPLNLNISTAPFEVIRLSESYMERARLFRALADPHRLMIVDMLSCGELCACVILIKFKITQPTLSHHMKILCDCGLVRGRKEGKWIYYSLNEQTVREFKAFLAQLTSFKENCLCAATTCCEGGC
jgi:ArsR family transcriptional regulator